MGLRCEPRTVTFPESKGPAPRSRELAGFPWSTGSSACACLEEDVGFLELFGVQSRSYTSPLPPRPPSLPRALADTLSFAWTALPSHNPVCLATVPHSCNLSFNLLPPGSFP